MRIDRLLGITLYLLNHETVTARALADRFEVSLRTMQRDVDALCAAGIPISSELGRNGGYRIMENFRMRQLSDPSERAYIVTAMQALFSAYPNDKIEKTLEKVIATHGPVGQQLILDFGALREHPAVNERLTELNEAVRRREQVSITYAAADGKVSSRIVEPLALLYRWYAWYVFAYCTEKRDYRTFKIIRIQSLQPLGLPFCKEHGDVASLMDAHCDGIGQAAMRILLKCRSSARAQIVEYLKGRELSEDGAGNFYYEMQAPIAERMWFALLLSFGDQITVLEPEELRERVKAHAGNILSLY